MALIAMAIYDTVENKRTQYTIKTVKNLMETVDTTKHRIFLIDNGSCQETKDFLAKTHAICHSGQGGSFGNMYNLEVITLPENRGTSGAINEGWRNKQPNEHLIKIDNDVIVNTANWVEQMEAAIERDPKIGILALKRKDLGENPWRNDIWQTQLHMLPHEAGEPWIIVEKANYAFGTCQMFNHRLIEKIGYMWQPNLYGYDDTLSSYRCTVAGFYNCFLSHIDLDHIDNTPTEHWAWKREQAAQADVEHQNAVHGYLSGTRSIYYNPYE